MNSFGHIYTSLTTSLNIHFPSTSSLTVSVVFILNHSFNLTQNDSFSHLHDKKKTNSVGIFISTFLQLTFSVNFQVFNIVFTCSSFNAVHNLSDNKFLSQVKYHFFSLTKVFNIKSLNLLSLILISLFEIICHTQAGIKSKLLHNDFCHFSVEDILYDALNANNISESFASGEFHILIIDSSL